MSISSFRALRGKIIFAFKSLCLAKDKFRDNILLTVNKSNLYAQCLAALLAKMPIYICFVYNPNHELNLLCSLFACCPKGFKTLVVIIGSDCNPSYRIAGKTMDAMRILRWPQMVLRLGNNFQRLISATSNSGLVDVTLCKSVPYQYPRVDYTGIKVLYYGDGFGVFPAGGRLWWNPLASNLPLDMPFTSNNYVNASLVTLGPKTFRILEGIENYLSLARQILHQKAMSLNDDPCEYLNSFTDVIILSQLTSAGRATEATEPLLYANYISHLLSKGNRKILLIPHPVHTIFFISDLLARVNTLISGQSIYCLNLLDSVVLPRDSLRGIQVEIMASLLNEVATSPFLHVFQTSYLSLSLLFENLKLCFGYPEPLIDRYFNEDAKDLQILFQQASVDCISCLRSQ